MGIQAIGYDLKDVFGVCVAGEFAIGKTVKFGEDENEQGKVAWSSVIVDSAVYCIRYIIDAGFGTLIELDIEETPLCDDRDCQSRNQFDEWANC